LALALGGSAAGAGWRMTPDPGRSWRMTPDPGRSTWPAWLRRVLLALSALSTVGVMVILGFLVSLFISGYSGGSNPESVAPLAFPVAMLGFVIAGVPAIVISAVLWAAYVAARRRA
jgi:hypothetical protein